MKNLELFQRERQVRMKEKDIVRYKPEDLPEPSQQEVDRIAAIQDDEIDFSDIPELDEEWFKTAEVGPPLPRQAISLRVEPKVLNWFKTRTKGKGYQTYMNAVLKSYVDAQLSKEQQ